jgi:hypothetical protein
MILFPSFWTLHVEQKMLQDFSPKGDEHNFEIVCCSYEL